MLRIATLVLLLPFVRPDPRIEVWDVLTIVAVGRDELNNSYAVPPSGTITLPVVAELVVVGRTTAEIASVIQNRLTSVGVMNPQVRITVQWIVTVTGSVNQPGGYVVLPGTRMEEVLQRARGTLRGAEYTIAVVRLVDGALITLQHAAKRDLVQRGDLVIVGPSRPVWR